MTRYRVTHKTIYEYVEPVTVSHNVLHLSPISTRRQQVEYFNCSVTPTPAIAHQRIDYFGNRVDSFTIQEQHTHLEVLVESVLNVEEGFSLDNAVSDTWEKVRDVLKKPSSEDELSAAEYCFDSRLVPTARMYAEYASVSFTAGRPLLEAMLDLTKRIYHEFTYDNEATAVTTTVPEVFKERRGVCQDFAHVQLACLRSLGLAARYVSGYLETEPPPGKEKLIGVDASHAWASIWCPGIGWIGFDPTNACVAGDRHIIVAVGRDFSDVSPQKGVILGGGAHNVTAIVDVTRL